MRQAFDPFRPLLISVAGWLGQQQRDAIDYLREENRVFREQLGGKRLRLNDDQRRRLAAKAKMLGRRILREASEMSAEVLPGWHIHHRVQCPLRSPLVDSLRLDSRTRNLLKNIELRTVIDSPFRNSVNSAPQADSRKYSLENG